MDNDINDKNRTQLDDANFWLIHKRQKLVGDRDFVPASYLHLAHFWGYVSDEQFNKGRGYGKIKGLLDQAQGNYIVWGLRMSLERQSRPPLTLEQEEKIEEIWRIVRKRITPQEMTQLDWLVHESISYDWDLTELHHRLKLFSRILEKL